ncbi:hybrid sensor histidine kinase/response regulator [Hydrogenophaga sp. RWCD_12]|uniref:ATP-binding response regulator n=1 Tax=Hydrogenophaga sp. RWCD_12 TaxID=3391190 RepID=UPI003984AA72
MTDSAGSPLPAASPAILDKHRARVLRELLRLSAKVPVGSIVWQTAISLLTVAYFAYPDHLLAGGIWLGLTALSQTMRLVFRTRDPGPDPDAIRRTLRLHRIRVLYSAMAWGSAGILLFDHGNAARQLALTVIMVSSCIGFSFSASSHAPTLKLALPLLVGPIIVSLFISPQPYMWVMGMIGTSFLVVMHRLIHDRGQQLEETLSLRMEAQEVREEKQRFFAAASHDLRQPLQALTLYHTVLAKGDTSPNVIERMGECIDALDRLLAGVLDIARLDAGKVVAGVEPIHLPELMLRVARMHDLALRDKGLRLRLHTQDEWVLSDPVLLERILSNLLSNAVRYTERGSILFAARRRGNFLLLQVFDTGIGIPDDRLDAVFGEFTQLHNPARDPSRGTGLGLATVQRLARLLDHPLSVRSAHGKGSCFSLSVARGEPPSATPAPARADASGASSVALPPWRILVVEDNALVREALHAMLIGWGMKATTEINASDAIARLRHESFDAVLSDWRLPGDGDGLSVLRHARENTSTRLAALLTGDDVQEVPSDFPVVSKPVRPLRLRALLTAHLEQVERSNAGP